MFSAVCTCSLNFFSKIYMVENAGLPCRDYFCTHFRSQHNLRNIVSIFSSCPLYCYLFFQYIFFMQSALYLCLVGGNLVFHVGHTLSSFQPLVLSSNYALYSFLKSIAGHGVVIKGSKCAFIIDELLVMYHIVVCRLELIVCKIRISYDHCICRSYGCVQYLKL